MKKLLLLFVSLSLLTACATPLPQSNSDQPLTKIAKLDESNLFAADDHGLKVAFSRDGLFLQSLTPATASTSLKEQKLSSLSPTFLAWSHDGSALAAAYPEVDYVTRVVVYAPDGDILQETTLPVTLSQMVWSARGDLLTTGFKLKKYSFGANLQQQFSLLNQSKVDPVLLTDSTLKPSTAREFETMLPELQPVIFSPYGDELVYVLLHDPPEFPPFLQIYYRNWQTSGHRKLLKLPLQNLELTWSDDCDSVTVQTSDGTQHIPLWPQTAEQEKQSRQTLMAPPRFSNGRLYNEQGQLLVDWEEGSQLQMLSDGRYLLALDNRLYLGNDLSPIERKPYSEKDWTLRRWRFEGLVTPAEYREQIQEMK
ncbi:MAG: hypothetical protein OET90_07500 [Desulfuromonadales bacterium]|nr:hypothetical protein [Desulfuromonadales bacterium]